jgi:transcription elongation factor Elf1
MKIKAIVMQYRRDFTAIYECEHCNHEEKGSGYDDAFFHNNVIPSMACESCGKKASDEYRPLAPKYSHSTVI